jgi:hypothetical protein
MESFLKSSQKIPGTEMLGIELLNADAGLTRVRCASKMKLQARKAV